MEESGGGGGGGGTHMKTQTHWWWGLASLGQLGWGISSYRKGYAGDSRLMPLKAFGVAALFVGAATSSSVAFLQASGIHKVEDLIEVGANIRTQLGVPSRAHHGKTDDL